MNNPSGEFRSMDYNFRLIDRYGRLLLMDTPDGFLLKRKLKDGFSFSEKGISEILIQNTMDKFEIPGVKKIGLVIEKN